VKHVPESVQDHPLRLADAPRIFHGVLKHRVLHLRGAYYTAYHEREHLSYAELDLEETPTDP
jgi:hypothetical protein